jgi:uncharacterized membrane protein YqjE
VASQFNEQAQESIKGLASSVRELKNDLGTFLQTRLQLLLAEMREKVDAAKLAAPFFVFAALLGALGIMLLTGALVYVIAMGIGVGYSLLVVGAAYVVVAAGCAAFGKAELSEHGITPRRTLEVLKQDQVWMQQEKSGFQEKDSQTITMEARSA